MTDKITPHTETSIMQKGNDYNTPVNEGIKPKNKETSERDTKKETKTPEAKKRQETFADELAGICDDYLKWCKKTEDNLINWSKKIGPKLDLSLQKHSKELSKLLKVTLATLAFLSTQIKKETHESEHGDTKEKTTWTAGTLGIYTKVDVEGKSNIPDFNLRGPLAETSNELVKKELPNMDKLYEPDPIKNGAWKSNHDLLEKNSTSKTDSPKEVMDQQSLKHLKDGSSR